MILNYIPLDDTENYFYTDNIWFAAAMKTKDIHYESFDKPGDIAIFIYERSPFIEDCWDFFQRNQLKVDVLSLAEAYKNIHRWINS